MTTWKYDPSKSFSENRKLQLEALGKTEVQTRESLSKPKQKVDDDLIPQVYEDRSEEDLQIDQIIANIDPITAYRKWIGKEVVEEEVSHEECHVSCPFPDHRDKHPSAWIRTRDGKAPKGTWFCGGCQKGGDIYDLAAIHFKSDDYKNGKNFHDLRKQMAESFGYRFKKVAGTEVVWKDEELEDQTPPAKNPPTPKEAPSSDTPAETPPEGDVNSEAGGSGAGKEHELDPAPVTVLHEKDVEDEPEEIDYPILNWRKIVPEDTFLDLYLKATSNDDSPEEYHFWHGLLALGHAAGRNVFLNDTRPVYGNLLVCLLGGTGYGKSRSRAWLDDVIEEALPFRDNGLDTSGCKLVPVPASGENLINHFQHIAHDPSLGKGAPEIRTPVNGIVDYDEFASLLSRAARQGATLKQIIMGFSDSRNKINTSSNTGGTYEAFQPFCSITASTQPKAVRPLLSRTDTTSGFLNRWIFVGGPRKQREVMGGVHSSIRVDLSPAVDALKAIRAWAAKERDIRFTEDGLDEYEKFVRKSIFPVQQRDESDLLTRLDLTLKRLVLLFCINEKKKEVNADVVKRVEPILGYLIKCYGILSAEIGITLMGELTSELLRHIKRIEEKTGRGASARDLGMHLKRKNYSPDLIKRALETMVALDWIDVDKTKGVGRPTVRYKVVGG